MSRHSRSVVGAVLVLGSIFLGLFRPAGGPAGEKAGLGAPPREGSTARPEGRAWRPAALEIDTPLSPPAWALLERELLRANTSACQEFFARYFDERGFLLCVERWGGDDGTDDAIECCAEWTLLHALGAPEIVLRLYRKAWEGHLRQYTQARTTEVPFARDGRFAPTERAKLASGHLTNRSHRPGNRMGSRAPRTGPFQQPECAAERPRSS